MSKKFIIEDLNELKEPTSISFKKYNITNQERTMNGSLVVDYIASKDSVNVSWDVLSDKEFKSLLSLIETKRADNSFYTVQYLKPGSPQLNKINAYTEEITYYPFFLADESVIWRDVTINFVEV